jgi:argininosuccinate lyase
MLIILQLSRVADELILYSSTCKPKCLVGTEAL